MIMIRWFHRKEVVRVFATVVEHVRLAKVIIFKKKKRKGYKKKKGMAVTMVTLQHNYWLLQVTDKT